MKQFLVSVISMAITIGLLQPAYAITTRLSETTLGAEADGSSFSVKLSDDGRFAVFRWGTGQRRSVGR